MSYFINHPLLQNHWKEVQERCKTYPIPDSEKNTPTEIIIKQPDLEIDSTSVQKIKIPEPENLKEYIGQEDNKECILTTLKIIKQIKPINIFLHGYPGCGKTTLSKIIAKELNAEFIYTIPEQLKDIDKIKSVLNTIQSSKKLVVWMVDEIHNIDKKLVNILLPILQDYRLGNVDVKHFVFIGATTDYNKLHNKSEALVSRFQTKIKLEKYTIDEIIKIIKQYHKKMNLDIHIPEEDYFLIAKNSKGIPREAINLLLKRLVSKDVNNVLKEHKIIKEGITDVDIYILNTLNNQEKAIGSSFLSQMVDLLQADYERIYEPYLIQKGFIQRTRSGRIITKKGKEFLKGLKNENKNI